MEPRLNGIWPQTGLRFTDAGKACKRRLRPYKQRPMSIVTKRSPTSATAALVTSL